MIPGGGHEDEESDVNDFPISRAHDWAIEDTVQAYRSGNPSEFFFDILEAKRPWDWYPRPWRKAAVDYLVASYTWHRRMEERDSLAECKLLAFMETYEWMYCQLAPKSMIPFAAYERGW